MKGDLRVRHAAASAAAVLLLVCAVSSHAQNETSTETLQGTAHLTVEDVVVTDRAGKAVLGLPQSAFHVADDGVPQTIRSFEESRDADAGKVTAGAQKTFSNAALIAPEANADVLLIDPIGIEIADQMFLRLEVLRYLGSMPAGTTMAVFRTSRDGRPLLVQSLTQDRTLLIRAVNNSVPTFAVTVPQDEVFYNAIAELSNVADYLVQAQGRKSLIWFAGRFPLSQTLGGNGAEGAHDFSASREALKSVYRKLEAARVVVFPIDVRGSMDASLAVSLPAATQPNQQSQGPNMIAGGAAEVQGSWEGMDGLAAATGGRAFHGNNRLTEQVRAAVDLGRHFYTLSYSAEPYAENGAWHAVRISLEGKYDASYRDGYFARSPMAAEGQVRTALHDRGLLPGLSGTASAAPIVFEATVQAGGGRPSTELVVQYAISCGDLQFKGGQDGRQQASLKVAALAYDASGTVLSNAVDDVTTHFNDEQMDEARKVGVPVVQHLTVAKRAKFLLLTVVDLDSGRTGTVQLTVESARDSMK
jgi:VWFA-related protein